MKSFSKWWSSANLQSVVTQKAIYCLIVAGMYLSISGSVYAGPEKYSDDLVRYLDQAEGPIPVVVMMVGNAYIPQAMAVSLTINERQGLIKQRMDQLQAPMREFIGEMTDTSLFGESVITRHKFFWTTNAMMATTTPDMIAELSDREDVQAILLDRRIFLERDYRIEDELSGEPWTYGLEKIGVPELRTHHGEVTGKGVVVGIIDTGIDPKHPEFEGKKITFKDFISNREEAYDDNGHGTHVAGTISGLGVSGTQIGIAPEVELVIAKAFSARGGASLSILLRAMEWVTDPTGAKDGKGRPRVVNNSWGGGMNDTEPSKDPFYQATLTWVQLEIFPSFAAGNSGPGSSTVGSPGGLPPAFAVGATDSEDAIARFSSRGPVELVMNGKKIKFTKPDVSAPGAQILSAMPGGKYARMSGTSMATPHVTGAVALLYQINPNLRVAQMRELLSKTTQDLGEPGMDNDFGTGRINVSTAAGAMENGLQMEFDF